MTASPQGSETGPGSVIPVVILNFNGETDTLECLASIKASERAGFVPVIVDNGSAPDALERLKRGSEALFAKSVSFTPARPDAPADLDEESLVFIEAGENLGFAKGNNLGVRFAEAIGASWVMLLNNDTVVAPDAFRRLRAFVEEHPTVVAVTPQIRDAFPGTRIQNCGGELTYFGSRTYRCAGLDASQLPAVPFALITFITGCALLFKFRDTGPLSEEFYFGEEDYEFSLRMHRRSTAMACLYGAVVWHKGGSTIRHTSLPVGSILVQYVNRLVNLRRYYSRTRWHATRVLAYLHMPVLLARNRIDPLKAFAMIRRTEAHLRSGRGVDRAAYDSMITSA